MKAYDKLAQELEATPAAERTIANLRSFKRDFVNGEKLERLSDQAQGGGALLGNSGGGRGMGGMPKGLTNLLDTLVGVPAQAATGKLGSTLVGAADKLRDEGVQKAIKRGAAAVGGIGALSMLGDQLDGLEVLVCPAIAQELAEWAQPWAVLPATQEMYLTG